MGKISDAHLGHEVLRDSLYCFFSRCTYVGIHLVLQDVVLESLRLQGEHVSGAHASRTLLSAHEGKESCANHVLWYMHAAFPTGTCTGLSSRQAHTGFTINVVLEGRSFSSSSWRRTSHFEKSTFELR